MEVGAAGEAVAVAVEVELAAGAEAEAEVRGVVAATRRIKEEGRLLPVGQARSSSSHLDRRRQRSQLQQLVLLA